MSTGSAYNDDKGGSSSLGEPEYGHDPASGGIFSSDYKSFSLYFERRQTKAPVDYKNPFGMHYNMKSKQGVDI
ncbi:AP3B2 protein, partial [Polypterus senegalus]|nr:AP3B2 protein [Polypterus senegalus]